MKTILTIFLLTLTLPAYAAEFSDYRVEPMKITRIPKLNGSAYRQFRTRANELLEDYKNGEAKTLAGHVLFTTFGCGTECSVLMGINLLNGEVKLFDSSVFKIEYYPNSRLLVVNQGALQLSFFYAEQQYVVDEKMNFRKLK